MKKRKKSFILKKRFIVFLGIIFFIIGSTSVKIFFNSTNTVVATSIVDTLDIIGCNNPVNQVLDQEIKMIEEKRNIEEIQRLEEEKKRAEEKKNQNTINQDINSDKKIAYLTFDDGPSTKVTPLILDVLKEYDIKATFFILGKMVNVNQDILKRTYEEGHSIGHHSYSHSYSHIYKNTANFINEIRSTERVLKNTLGEDFQTKLLRLPGGSFEKYKKKILKEVERLGYKNYDWNSLNGDAEGNGISKEKLLERLKETSRGKKELIILMHDTDAKKTTVEALPLIIEYLIFEGYEFRALTQ